MSKDELRQRMILCIATLQNLNGHIPELSELYTSLGSEYAEVMEEYYHEKNAMAAAA